MGVEAGVCESSPPFHHGRTSVLPCTTTTGVTLPRHDDPERDLKRYRRPDVPSAHLDIASSIAPGCAKEARVVDATSSPALADAITRGAGRFEARGARPSISPPLFLGWHVMNPRVGETHRETRGWGAVVSPRGGRGGRTDVARAAPSCLRGDRSHSGSMVWRWLEARRIIEMGRRFVPPPPPTNRPQMREWGRERPPSPTRETGFRAVAEGRSRPVRRCLRAVRQLRCWRVVCVRTTWAFELSHSCSAW